MSLKHEFKCDSCGKRAEAKYNGEHYLPPQGWVQLYDDNRADMVNQHLCDACRPGARKPKKKVKK